MVRLTRCQVRCGLAGDIVAQVMSNDHMDAPLVYVLLLVAMAGPALRVRGGDEGREGGKRRKHVTLEENKHVHGEEIKCKRKKDKDEMN